MSRRHGTSWWQQSWVPAVLVVVGLVLAVFDIRAQAWLALVGTVLALVAFVIMGIAFRRQRGERRAEGTPDQ